MRKITAFLFAISVAAISLSLTAANTSAQDRTPPLLNSFRTTLYTSPLQATNPQCNVVNVSDHTMQIETHLVYTMGPLVDDTSVQSTDTLLPRETNKLDATVSLLSESLLYCRFSFQGKADSVRAIMVGQFGNLTVSSEAR